MTLTVDLQVTRIPVSGDFSVGPGEVLAVTGPNGRGKTTFLHAIAGLVPCTGTVTVDGRPLDAVEDRRFGVVFQDRRLPPWLSALSAAAMGGDRDDARAWLDRLGIAHLGRTKVSRLSGGEQQRVAIARALAGPRSALLLDEPFTALDRDSVQTVREAVFAHARGAALPVVLVTHDGTDVARATTVLSL